MWQLGYDDEGTALNRLSQLGDRLEWLNKAIDWSIFIPLLEKAKPDKTRDGKGGRPPLSPLMMFKIAILQQMHNTSDDTTEFLLNDRLSWKRFLGLGLAQKAPDAKSIWLFRDILQKSGVYEELFDLFTAKMEEMGVITHRGSIVDASFVDAPRQRNSREENETIKEGGIPEAWLEEDCANMLAQKDTDARWAKKNDELHFGYKDHVLCDADSKMIVDYRVSAASVHDSQVFVPLLSSYIHKLRSLWADSAYIGAEFRAQIMALNSRIILRICEKGSKGNPLTKEQKESNREKSRTRSRVEHIFGHMSGSMQGMSIRSIGRERTCCVIGLKNLAYNMARYVTLFRQGAAPAMA